MSALVERFVEGLISVVARLIENGLTSGEDQAAAWERVADVAKLRASAQEALNKRRAER